MDFEAAAGALRANIEKVIDGKPDVVETAIVVFLAEGHLLIEDVPGVGKTVLAKALAKSSGCAVRRIQFTPDLLPSDITGVSVFVPSTREFEFKPGAVFANIVIGDEINRASPKTQSALLEAMEERQVTVDGTTYELGSPFTVVATQNPFEMEGTYALPEAQRDRFMARIRIGYPDAAAELEMVRGRDSANPLDSLDLGRHDRDGPADDRRRPRRARLARRSSSTPSRSPRPPASHPDLRLGASPRATLQLIRAAKARAAIGGRDYVLPDDLDALAPVVLPHRLVAHRGGASAEDIVASIVAQTPVPAEVPRGAQPA